MHIKLKIMSSVSFLFRDCLKESIMDAMTSPLLARCFRMLHQKSPFSKTLPHLEVKKKELEIPAYRGIEINLVAFNFLNICKTRVGSVRPGNQMTQKLSHRGQTFSQSMNIILNLGLRKNIQSSYI